MIERYQCEQCDWIGARDAAVPIENPGADFKPGQTFTDRKCPSCGYHCFPAKRKEPPPFPLTGLTVEQDIGPEAWAEIKFGKYYSLGAAHMFDRVTNRRHATLFAAAGEMLLALEAWLVLADRATAELGVTPHPDEQVIIRKARAAVAKARAAP